MKAFKLAIGTGALVSLMIAGGCAGSKSRGSAAEVEELTSVERSTIREDAFVLLTDFAEAPEPELRANAIEAMSGAPGRIERYIAQGLIDTNEAVRFSAAMVAGYDRIDALTPSLLALLNDTSPSVRAAAIYALVRCGEPVDRSSLAVTLLDHPSPRHRANVAFVLGELGDPSALPLLRDAVRDQMTTASQSQVRILRLQISEAMIKLGDESQVESVRAALYPSRPEELEDAALAVQIIGEVQDKGALDQLIYLAAYRERGQMMPAEVRLAAAASLAKMGERGGYPIAEEYEGDERGALRAQAAFVYGQTGHETNLPRLQVMMEDESPLVRLAAAAAVLELTDGPMTASVPE